MSGCMYCGADISPNSTFCPKCGKKQVKVYSQTFRRENMSEEEFIARINQWFAQYPYIANVKGSFLLNHGIGLLVNKYVLDAFSIEYEVINGTNENQYGLVCLSATNLVKVPTDTLIDQWRKENPGAKILCREGGVNQRGNTGSLLLGGIGAMNKTQLYVFFKYNREKGISSPAE